jgi:GAF domain-containing protein
MLTRGHRLGVGQTGIVGFVTATGNHRIALDTVTDTVYFDNPDLPETRSEMALPIRVGGSIIGALDVQSTESNAFSEDDVEVLSILADEVGVAIDNARLYAESQRILAEAQKVFQEYTAESWRNMVAKRKIIGYELSGVFIRPLEKPAKGTGSTISVPIKLRNQVIGSMNINLPAGNEWTPDEMEIAQALAERGIASESAALLMTQHGRPNTRSARFPKIIATTDISEILKLLLKKSARSYLAQMSFAIEDVD